MRYFPSLWYALLCDEMKSIVTITDSTFTIVLLLWDALHQLSKFISDESVPLFSYHWVRVSHKVSHFHYLSRYVFEDWHPKMRQYQDNLVDTCHCWIFDFGIFWNKVFFYLPIFDDVSEFCNLPRFFMILNFFPVMDAVSELTVWDIWNFCNALMHSKGGVFQRVNNRKLDS